MEQLTGVIGFLGYGNMGEAIVSGLLGQGLTTPNRICIYDALASRMEAGQRTGLSCASSPEMLAATSDILVIAVKPQQMAEALAPLVASLRAGTRIVSIMAGVSMKTLQRVLGEDAPIIRVMPNTPALVGAGAAALAHNDRCTADDVKDALAIFTAVGIAEVVPEAQLDAITALSGSGPAYFFYLTECLVEAACAEGLPEHIAQAFAAQTLAGSGKLLLGSGKAPGTLREQVTSKGGTTFAALETFRQHHFSDMVAAAFRAAAERSRELGRNG